MSGPLLTSRDNPLIKTIRLVARSSHRAPAGLVLAEGIRVLEEATTSGHIIDAVLASEEFGADPRERNLLRQWSRGKVPVRRAAASLLKPLSDVVSPQGALALVRVPAPALGSLPETDHPLILCLDGIQDPGNFGTLVRSALASGTTAVVALAGTVSARNPKAVRASAGAFFHLPVAEGVTAGEFLEYCRRRRIRIYRADAEAQLPYWKVDFKSAAAILLGNEARGARGKEWDRVGSVSIPMAPAVESLNVAAAGTVLLVEARRQRQGPPSSRDGMRTQRSQKP